ncbi:inosamine-phosphate amidinotransferase 1 [Streptomyces sp. NPDC003006]
MSLVGVHSEWDPLEEIVVGHAGYGRPEIVSPLPYPDRMVKEAEEELENLCEELRGLGVRVRRPLPVDHAVRPADPAGETGALGACRPRDGLLTVGGMIIQTPTAFGGPGPETPAYKTLLMEYFTSGSTWIAAPRPRLTGAMGSPAAPAGERLPELEPVFDAGNVLRLGADLLYLVSGSGNVLGARWLRAVLGEAYRVHMCRGVRGSSHGASAVVPLRPGLVLVNPDRVDTEGIPAFLRTWKRVVCPEAVDTGCLGGSAPRSAWIGANMLVVRPGLVIVNRRQGSLMRVLESNGIDVLPLEMTHSRALGNGFHRATLDVRRTGTLEKYRF